jgi:hypothetical protein
VTEAAAIELVLAQFATQWAALQPTIPFVLENEAMSAADTFALCTVTHTAGAQISQGNTGNRRVERKGFIFVKLHAPVDVGRRQTSQLADTARTIFECVTLAASPEPVTVLAGETIEVGVDGRWYMTMVRFPFRYYAVV